MFIECFIIPIAKPDHNTHAGRYFKVSQTSGRGIVQPRGQLESLFAAFWARDVFMPRDALGRLERACTRASHGAKKSALIGSSKHVARATLWPGKDARRSVLRAFGRKSRSYGYLKTYWPARALRFTRGAKRRDPAEINQRILRLLSREFFAECITGRQRAAIKLSPLSGCCGTWLSLTSASRNLRFHSVTPCRTCDCAKL